MVDAAEVAKLLGIELDDWQRTVLDVALEVDGSGFPVHRDVVVSLPRQQGKSTVLFVYAIFSLLRLEGGLVLFGAQQRQDARTRLSRGVGSGVAAFGAGRGVSVESWCGVRAVVRGADREPVAAAVDDGGDVGAWCVAVAGDFG